MVPGASRIKENKECIPEVSSVKLNKTFKTDQNQRTQLIIISSRNRSQRGICKKIKVRAAAELMGAAKRLVLGTRGEAQSDKRSRRIGSVNLLSEERRTSISNMETAITGIALFKIGGPTPRVLIAIIYLVIIPAALP